MARKLRKWDPTKRSTKSGAEQNSILTDMVAMQSQDMRNKSLSKGLKKAQRRYERQAGFLQNRSTAINKSANAVKSQAKSVESAGQSYASYARRVQTQMQESAARHRQDLQGLVKQYKQGDINKKQYKRYTSRASSKYNAQQAAYQSQAAQSRSSYEGALASYKSSASRVQAQQQRYKKQVRNLGKYERKYDRARSAYEQGYYGV